MNQSYIRTSSMSKVKKKKKKGKSVWKIKINNLKEIEKKIMHLFVGLKNGIQICSING